MNNAARPGSRASWLIKTGFGPWVKYKGPAKGTRRHVLTYAQLISQTSSAIRCLGTNTHARAQLESVRAGLGWLCRPRLPCLERRAPGNRTEDKAATWVNAAKAAKTKKNYVSVGLVTKMFNAHTFVQWSSWGNRAILPGSQPPMTSIGRCTESADWGRGLPLPRVITERNTSMRWLAV